ncbi:MAG: hypothetical protein KIH67_002195 [Candidatus Moranbacteria bacterium]|nr:hypothetical protein [Candidatus Moranbacteria bacterium]
MPQTFYIESDEEIISAIGRLRHSNEIENFFVFPKRALILQSIINLRLFQKEAQKMNKKIIVVTQDEIGRMLAEKAGIKTENYSDDFSQKANHIELERQAIPQEESSSEEPELKKDFATVKASSIGSSSFFTAEPEPEILLPKPEPPAPVEPPKPQMQQLRIRNASPFRPPSLNSMRPELQKEPTPEQQPLKPIVPPQSQAVKPAPQMEAIYGPRPTVATPVTPRPTPVAPPQAAPLRPSAVQPVVIPQTRPVQSQVASIQTPRETQPERSAMLKSFFAPKDTVAKTPLPVNPKAPEKQKAFVPEQTPKASKPPQEKKTSPAIHRSFHGLFYFFGLMCFLIVGGVFAYLFFPKVTVKITPLTAEEKIDTQVKGVPGASDAIDSTPVRLLERDVPVTVTGTATDSSSSTTEKARGMVVIYNDYSSDSQSLVATTRLESPDGKIFRLVKSVTIPGKTSSPGAIEVEVVADQAGENSNIEPTTFTIPGFKGSDKFDKFSGKSLKAMTGGGSGGSEIKSIARADLDKAELEAKAQAEVLFTKDLESSLVPGEVYLKESLQITPLDTGNRPKEGIAANTFEYTRTYKMKAFLLQENLLKKKVEAASAKESQGVHVVVSSIDIDYGEIAPNYDDNTVNIKLHATISKVADLEKESLKTKLLGRNAAAIESFLGENPGVQKIELDFEPKWFGSSIPKQASRVEVVIE